VRVALWIALPMIPVVLLTLAILGALPYKLYPIHTDSMNPALPMKTLIIVEKGSYEKGDIITFNHRTLGGHNEVVTHRYIGRDNNGLIVTKGDANPSPDAWPVKDEDVIGGVSLRIPQAGYWLVYMKNPAGSGSIVLLIFAVWLLFSGGKQTRSGKTS
jgi:signal peptidase